MDRFLSLSQDDRRQAFEQAALARGLASISIEKDFWVCLTLRELFALPEYGEHLTFKGGTSLSKAWGLIDRFSEDIDLTLERDYLGFGAEKGPEQAASRKERQRRLKALRDACRVCIAEKIQPALAKRFAQIIADEEQWTLLDDDDDPDGQTLLFAYPRFGTPKTVRYLRDQVKLEFGARSDPWPVETRTVTPIVAEEFPALFSAPESSVRALLPERTFWEKVLLVHEETFRPPEKPRPRGMARHYYDVWRLIEKGVASKALQDMALFERVASHRQVYFRQNWVDYETLKRGSIRLLPRADQDADWRSDYEAMRGEMFAGETPPFDDILSTVHLFELELNDA